MINDFIDDLVDQLEDAGLPYILIVENKNGLSAQCRSNVSKWRVAKSGVTKREDVHQLMDVTVFAEGNDGICR